MPGFDPRPGHVGFVEHNILLGQIFFDYFDFSYQFLFQQMFHTYILSGADIKSHLVPEVPSGLILTALQGIKEINFR
jgi:hypothetical protein